MNTLVKITQEHIDHGIPSHVCYCPLALALRGVVKEEHVVAIGVGEFLIDDFYGKLTAEIDDWTDRFDKRSTVGPVEFMIDIPEEYLR